MKYIYTIISFSLCFFLHACSHEPHVKDGKLITINAETFTNALYYSGTIQPLKTVVIPSPADGVIVDMPIQYGDEVSAGQLLFMVSSSKFMTDYKTALMAYIKAKSEFSNSQSQLSEAKFLHKNLLISDDDYKMKQSSYYTSQLAFLQAKDALESLIHQLDMKDVNLYKLSIADIDKITKAMHFQKTSENLPILSSCAGTILSVTKNEDDNSKKFSKGDVIKQGDALAIIGDMNGLTVHIKVNELVVNQIKVGQKIKVTGIAFPDDVLNGTIARVDRQGETASGGVPSFSVEVVVPKLTSLQKKLIHVGMSAKVEIDLSEDSQIKIPIKAVTEKGMLSVVRVYDQHTGKINEVAVQPGKTTPDAVIILSGLKTGDKIVVPN